MFVKFKNYVKFDSLTLILTHTHTHTHTHMHNADRCSTIRV